MEQREFLNSAIGFAEIINEETDIIKENYDDIGQCEDAQQKGFQLYDSDNLSVILTSRQYIVTHSLKLIFAKYSAGVSIEDIKKDYIVALNEKSIVWRQRTLDSFSFNDSEPFYSTDEYWEIMQIISLGIMLNVTEEDVYKITSIRDKIATPDILLDYLCSYFHKRDYNFGQSIGNKYNGLVKTIKECSTDNASSLMKTYLNKQWFKDYKRQGILPTHNSKFNIHKGYWSFESGAVMKILKADDSILKGQQFYPYDMVHWQQEL